MIKTRQVSGLFDVIFSVFCQFSTETNANEIVIHYTRNADESFDRKFPQFACVLMEQTFLFHFY